MKVNGKKRLTKAGWLLFYLYIILLSYFLFFSEHYGRVDSQRVYRYNLVLFKEIRRYIEYRRQIGFESFLVNIPGNILAFVPFGFMLPMLNKKYKGFLAVTFFSLLFSVTAEVVQLIFKVGTFDVDDMLLNTVGGMLGYLLYLTYSLLKRLFHHKNHNRK